MLVIRFSRVGKKNHAQYKLVLAEKTYPIQGKFIEHLGSYDPHQKKSKLNKERINYWIEKGAQCSDSVHNLLIREAIIKGEKRFLKLGKKKKESEDEEGKTKEGKDEKKDDKTGEKVEEKKEEVVSEDSKQEASQEASKEGAKEEEKPKDNEKKEENKPDEAKEEKK